ncbi:putative bifunctional diguanylate cyclase/phosphodiesterase [Pseudomonas fulva]|uniref:putative bifunctional diguanylate cyclase/phosphodiesterase n=1 Tax=Pseudomonas fulva TaxID=47880 RepID=UPI002DB830BB|nr:EAL domain-containing protein [Pseudomonas fulva]MEB8059284.1 EAL domain-containing protein [Pseudomonas fulva]
MYSEILSKSPFAVVYVATGHDLITYANNAANQLFHPACLAECTLLDLIACVEHARFLDFLDSSVDCDEFIVAKPFASRLCNQNESKPIAMIIKSSLAEGVAFHVQPIGIDIEQEKFNMALFDPLTSLPNRELFRDRAEQAIYAASRLENVFLGILFVDLDYFKKVNDVYGHAAGDAVLVEVAERLRSCLRESDTVARLGGDEFVVLICNLRDVDESAIVAERILDACSKPILVGQNIFQISASVGVAAWPTDGLTVDELLHHADLAMYSSKGEGRNTLRFYDARMNEKMEMRAQLEADLKEALRDGDFVLHYQPQYCSRLKKIVAAEALIRWQHPVRGLIPPASFIRVAEDTNLITPIGDWVLQEAVEQGRRWLDAGLYLRVAVNLSGRQFVDSLPARVSEVLTNAKFPPELLELELTESFLVTDIDKAARILRELRSLGVRVALDDFGTGWSSLNYLKNFPVDTLKIDRSFVGSSVGLLDERVIKAILAIAREFELTTLAEGVETPEQLEHLTALGCDAWQGFLLSSAIAADDMATLYNTTVDASGMFSVQTENC